jgi:two-component system, OmpR family, bacitracin resistance sensor histidine kinase BceS
MIRNFISERRSWILFLFLLQLLLVFAGYIDPSVSLSAIFYINFLSLLLFIIFLFSRYQKETRFFSYLKERENSLDVSNTIKAKTPFEKIVEESILEQTNYFKREASQNRIHLEQEKDDMLSWIHEVKTPLTAMHLMIQRMEDQGLKSDLTYEWLRIHLLLDQQLHQKRIPFIENDLYMEVTDLELLLFSELKSMQSWCIQKGIGFDLDLQVQHVLSDSKWLAFIVRQILTNAIKYSHSSDITIKSYKIEDHTFLEIKDFGRGIDSRDLPRIFDKGFTSTTKHADTASTGMGLYLAKKAADSLNIKITPDSQLNDGTTITLAFPLKNEFDHIKGM